MTSSAQPSRCAACGLPKRLVTRRDGEVVAVCLDDACPIVIRAHQRAENFEQWLVLARFIGIGLRWVLVTGLLYLFVRWAAS